MNFSIYRWIVQLWRIVFLFLGFTALFFVTVSWILTGDTQLIFFMIFISVGIVSVTYGVHALFSINIFSRRLPKLGSRSGPLLVHMCALGLYLGVVGAIFFATSYMLLRVMQLPHVIVLATVAMELAVFSAIGYIGFTRLRKLTLH